MSENLIAASPLWVMVFTPGNNKPGQEAKHEQSNQHQHNNVTQPVGRLHEAPHNNKPAEEAQHGQGNQPQYSSVT